MTFHRNARRPPAPPPAQPSLTHKLEGNTTGVTCCCWGEGGQKEQPEKVHVTKHQDQEKTFVQLKKLTDFNNTFFLILTRMFF